MGFKAFLTEGSKEITQEEIVGLIRKNCKPYIKAIKSTGPLLRGMNFDTKGMSGIADVRKDRISKDSSKESTLFLDKFSEQQKIPKRSESVFTSFDKSTTSTYGRSYYVFPVADYEILVFNVIEDMFNDSPEMSRMIRLKEMKNKTFAEIVGAIAENPKIGETDNYQLQNFLEDLRDYTVYKAGEKLKKTKNEYIIDCKSYYYVLVGSDDSNSLIEEIMK